MKTSTDEKILMIEKKIQQILNPEQSLIIVGNKVVKLDTPLENNSYTKLIVEIKYAQFQQHLLKNMKPRVTISYPTGSIQRELKQLMLFNQSDMNIVDSLIGSFNSGKYEGSVFLNNEKRKNKSIMRQVSESTFFKGNMSSIETQ